MRLTIGARLVGNFVPVTDVLILLVVDSIVAGEFLADLFVGRHFVGHQFGLAREVRANDRLNVGNANAVNVEAAGRTAALNESKNHVLVSPSATALLWRALKATVESLVNLDNAATAAHGRHKAARAHGFANAMGQEPRGFIGDAQGPMKLMGANALLG